MMKFFSVKAGTIALSFFAIVAPLALPVQADDKTSSFDRTTQMGPDPVLPEPNSYRKRPVMAAVN